MSRSFCDPWAGARGLAPRRGRGLCAPAPPPFSGIAIGLWRARVAVSRPSADPSASSLAPGASPSGEGARVLRAAVAVAAVAPPPPPPPPPTATATTTTTPTAALHVEEAEEPAANPSLDAADRHWMGVALEQARLAGERGEVPVGAVVVVRPCLEGKQQDEGASASASASGGGGGAPHPPPSPPPPPSLVLGAPQGNRAEALRDPTAHAEALALRSALAPSLVLGAPQGNRAEALRDPTAHAEALALRSALAALAAGDASWRASLPRATLYATCEPCPMCAGAALACRVGRVVYGCRQPRVGADGSWLPLLRAAAAPRAPMRTLQCLGAADSAGETEAGEEEEKEAPSPPPPPLPPTSLPSPLPPSPRAPHPYNPGLEVRSGVRAAEAAELLQAFFRRRRRKDEVWEEQQM